MSTTWPRRGLLFRQRGLSRPNINIMYARDPSSLEMRIGRRLALLGATATALEVLNPKRARATITTVTTSTGWSTIATDVAGAASGDEIVFAPGAYTHTQQLFPANGLSIIGLPGANITIGASQDIIRVDNNTAAANPPAANTSNISVAGLTFIGNGSTNVPAHGVFYYNNANNLSFNHNTFSNFTDSGGTSHCFNGHGSTNVRIDNNTANQTWQMVAIQNTSASLLSGLSISGNVMNGILRNAIECPGANGQGGFNNFHVNNNVIIGDANTGSGGGLPISIVQDPAATGSANDVQCIGNDIWGPWGTIEIQAQTCIVAYNRFTDTTSGGISIGNNAGHGVYIFGNTFRNIVNAGFPVTKSGGWTDGQWIGANMVNGSLVVGGATFNSGGGISNTVGLVPPAWVPQQSASALFSPTGPAISPAMQAALGSAPLGPLSSWNIYP